MQVKGAVGLVTGGASGLGEAVVRMLAAEGASAVILDVPGSRGAELASEVGESAIFLPADVTDTDQVASAVAQAAEAFGRIDLCVNCAGVSPAHRVVKKDGTLFPLDVFRRAVDVNLVGLFDVVRQAAGAMARNEPGPDGERGLIVNTASIAGIEGQIGQAAYSASKGGVIGLTLPAARELAKTGVRVVTIAPGLIETPMFAGLPPGATESLTASTVFPARLGMK